MNKIIKNILIGASIAIGIVVSTPVQVKAVTFDNKPIQQVKKDITLDYKEFNSTTQQNYDSKYLHITAMKATPRYTYANNKKVFVGYVPTGYQSTIWSYQRYIINKEIVNKSRAYSSIGSGAMFGGILYITDTIKYNFDNNKNMTSITITTSYTYKEYSKIILAETTTTTYKVKAIVNKQGVKLDKQSLDKINKQQKQNVQGVFNLIKDRIK